MNLVLKTNNSRPALQSLPLYRSSLTPVKLYWTADTLHPIQKIRGTIYLSKLMKKVGFILSGVQVKTLVLNLKILHAEMKIVIYEPS